MYDIIIESNAEKDLNSLESDIFHRITNKIKLLSSEPRPVGCRKLKTFENNWRIREGNYRIIYEIDDKQKQVKIMRVRHRKVAYR